MKKTFKQKYTNKCLRCKTEWSSSHPGQFCSDGCNVFFKRAQIREQSGALDKMCIVCNVEFKSIRVSTVYCSVECNNHNWFKNNRDKHNFKEAKRRAAKLNATPKWLNEDHWKQIKQIYETCPPGYHVDHIVPLQGENVSGLHTPWNLQHLPALENIIKGNKVSLCS